MIFANPTDPNGPDLVDACRAATRRTYPDGYGYAMVYCRDPANATIELHAAACAAVAFAFGKTGLKRQLHKDSDIARFVTAMAQLPSVGTIRQWHDADGKPVTLARTIRQNSDGTYEGGWTIREYPAPYGWLIEGCQLVLGVANDSSYPEGLRQQCRAAMKAAGHPGF